MFGTLDKRIAILEATMGFLKDRLSSLEASITAHASEMARKVDKIESSLSRQDERLEKMHNQNQAWIRGVAYGIITLLLYGLWSTLKAQFHLP